MPTWTLVIQTTTGSHEIPVGSDESVAVRALADARGHIGKAGTVTIADRLALRAEHIISVRIEEISDPSIGIA